MARSGLDPHGWDGTGRAASNALYQTVDAVLEADDVSPQAQQPP